MLKINSKVCTVLEKSKETVLEFYKGTAKSSANSIMFEYSKINVKLSDTQLKKAKNCCQK